MDERSIDRLLGIRTVGIREWRNHTPHYNRYEATPYAALEKFFTEYRLSKKDRVVDFGSGRGRVAFYLHHRFQVAVTGVEVHEITIEEALENLTSYQHKLQLDDVPIRFDFGLAEQYAIDERENCFYFFNPFSVQIFKQVVANILHSVEQKERSVDLILYYPLKEYTSFLRKKTPFQLAQRMQVPGFTDKHGLFKVFRIA